MAEIYIPGMEMPETGCYFVGVDNSNGKDKTVITVARRIRNTSDRYVIGSYELVPVPDHGRLIDADALANIARKRLGVINIGHIDEAPTIIPARKEEQE